MYLSFFHKFYDLTLLLQYYFLVQKESLCLSADEYPELKSNHVYFTDDDDDDNLYHSRSMKNPENCTVEKIVSPHQLASPCPCVARTKSPEDERFIQ
jgi:hypothetical protein